MNAFASLETTLNEPLDAAIHIDAPDKLPASETDRVVQFRSEMRILMPHVLIAAVPNAGKRGQWAINQAKREGMLPGFPDLICMAPRKVAFLEFKSGTGKPAQHQIDILHRLHRMHFPVGVFRRADSAIGWLRSNGFGA